MKEKKQKEKKQKKEKYVENHGILKNGKDYHVYHMTSSDYILSCLLGFAAGFIVLYAFFSNGLVSVLAGAGCAVFAPKVMNGFRKKKVLNALREQFRDLLDSLSASYTAGKNTVQAFDGAEADMAAIYGPASDIVNEVKIIKAGLSNSLTIEVMLMDFARRSGLDDIESFANVFEVCNRQGGDLKRIVCQSRDIIAEKIDIEMEIETMISGSRNELRIMVIMPMVVVLMLNGLGSEFGNTLANIGIKLGCMAIFVIAYVIGNKITKIRV